MNASRNQVHEEQNVVGDEHRFCPHFRGEEAPRRKGVHVRADEIVPRRCFFPLWRGRYTVVLQYVADGLISLTRCPSNRRPVRFSKFDRNGSSFYLPDARKVPIRVLSQRAHLHST